MPLWGVLVGAALLELVLLRSATRTLIHIPGLGRYEAPIRAVAEVGRFGYYLAVASLVAILVLQGLRGLVAGPGRHIVRSAAALVFLGTASAGRLGLLTTVTVVIILLLLVVIVAATGRQGLPMVPIAFFISGLVAAGVTVVGQEIGGALTGGQVDGLILGAEVALIFAALTAPLLLRARPGGMAMAVGGGAAVLTVGAFTGGSSTLSILVLWNLGVPGWLPSIVYAVAAGSLAATLWSALTSGQRLTAGGLALLAAGGIGTISTYQTGLVLAGLLLAAQDASSQGRVTGSSSPAGQPLDLGRPGTIVGSRLHRQTGSIG